MEGEGCGAVADGLVGEAGGGHELDGVEGGPRHIDAVDGGQVAELVEGGGLSVGFRRLDLAADLLHGLRDEGRFADQLEAHPLDQVVQGPLEQVLHNR